MVAPPLKSEEDTQVCDVVYCHIPYNYVKLLYTSILCSIILQFKDDLNSIDFSHFNLNGRERYLK